MELCQGSDSAANYAVKFCTLVAQSGWNDTTLLSVFQGGLHPAVQAEMACHDTNTMLSQYIGTARQHRVSTQPPALYHRTAELSDPREEPVEPMQLERAYVSEEECRCHF